MNEWKYAIKKVINTVTEELKSDESDSASDNEIDKFNEYQHIHDGLDKVRTVCKI